VGEKKTDKMDVDTVVRLLNEALRLQYRSALQYALASGGMTGLSGQTLAADFAEWSRHELDDCCRLVEKIAALGGTPTTEVAEPGWDEDAETLIRSLADNEAEAIEALHEVIPETGQEPRSEALEHIVEHLIMRKQQQLDVLLRILRSL
jgi:bacterioferritin (cytochrome b1)